MAERSIEMVEIKKTPEEVAESLNISWVLDAQPKDNKKRLEKLKENLYEIFASAHENHGGKAVYGAVTNNKGIVLSDYKLGSRDFQKLLDLDIIMSFRIKNEFSQNSQLEMEVSDMVANEVTIGQSFTKPKDEFDFNPEDKERFLKTVYNRVIQEILGRIHD